MGQTITYAIPVFGVLALLYTFWRSSWVSKQEVGTDRMATHCREHCRRCNGIFESGISSASHLRGSSSWIIGLEW